MFINKRYPISDMEASSTTMFLVKRHISLSVTARKLPSSCSKEPPSSSLKNGITDSSLSCPTMTPARSPISNGSTLKPRLLEIGTRISTTRVLLNWTVIGSSPKGITRRLLQNILRHFSIVHQNHNANASGRSKNAGPLPFPKNH